MTSSCRCCANGASLSARTSPVKPPRCATISRCWSRSSKSPARSSRCQRPVSWRARRAGPGRRRARRTCWTRLPAQNAQRAAPTLHIGPIALPSPVVLAPMAGVTNVAFRTLCRELELARAGTVSGLYVCEMVTARALVERHPVTMHMTTFAPDESPRSLQLYTVDPDTTFAAAKMIADDGLADHIDMNFGCPVPKVTRRGGGAALPFKRRLFGQIVAAAVRATQGTDIPVTVKFRIGIDDAHHTHLDAGRIAEAEGAAAVALHARTAAQRYSGSADWEQIALLKQQVRTIPVLGNGDIYDASDALTMMAATGCDGVVIGRGCLGRPWLFSELSAAVPRRQHAVAPTPGAGPAI